MWQISDCFAATEVSFGALYPGLLGGLVPGRLGPWAAEDGLGRAAEIGRSNTSKGQFLPILFLNIYSPHGSKIEC